MGALLMGLAPSFPCLLAGRIVAGIGVGYALNIAPIYTAELSPAMSRGLLTSLPEVFITFGILLGYILNYALSSLPVHINWRLMLSLAAVPAIGIAFSVMIMPESPRWLAMKGKLSEAKQVLVKTSSTEDEAELRYQEITKATLGLGSAHEGDPNGWSGQGVWKELFVSPTRPIRRMLVAAIGINFFMQASGNDAVIYYCPEVFRAAGIHKKKHLFGTASIVVGLRRDGGVARGIGLGLEVLGGLRPQVGLGHHAVHSSRKRRRVVLFNWARPNYMGILFGDFPDEASGPRLEPSGVGKPLVSGVVSMTFLTISKEITFGGMFFVLGGVMVVATMFFYFFLPETKGKTLEEMETIFDDKTNPN
ncbi:hypothetical protein TIFTF001_019686 [Ficus carica]|uniref:Major facilitator superfamily (MFS) profile domain-containing protein n=1 Tax=Ficus carica TaxID=3494 RepID=A0AA88DC00_FICCA|nr:hypothetical protein TIFTF001_019686 [Ficus carica]